jgi:hypothetical protein
MEVIAKRRKNSIAPLQVIEGGKKTARANASTAMNQHIRRSIYRVVLESDLDIRRLQQVVSMFRVPEATVIAAMRETHRERQTPPPASVRRAAA